MDLRGFRAEIGGLDMYRYMGKIEKIVGMTIESTGPECSIGDICRIYSKEDREHFIYAEVVGFQSEKVLLMPVSPRRVVAMWRTAG